jgi:putative tryptophan/tyrosine transport system substrate-binding protein
MRSPPSFVEEGGLMSYSVDQKDQFRRAAELVDRILRRTSPADIPVEQPIQFTLALNPKTARAQGLTIPQSLLLRADEVIR